MKELETLRLDSNILVLENVRVKSAVIPQSSAEMDRDVQVQGETVIDGAVYARNMKLERGPLTVSGAVFVRNDLLVAAACQGDSVFRKAVACHEGITAVPESSKVYFGADVNAKTLNLKNCFVAANLFASSITLENCVVLGGVFATRQLDLKNVVIGTFNSPGVKLSGRVFTLLPSVFAVEPILYTSDTELYSLTLADLGNLMRGMPEMEKTGKIRLDPKNDLQKTMLSDARDNHILLNTYSVAGKVLSADMLDFEKLQNHFLLAAGSLGEQLWKQYDLGCDKDGKVVNLCPQSIAKFFFDILDGSIQVRDMDGEFSLKEIVDAYS